MKFKDYITEGFKGTTKKDLQKKYDKWIKDGAEGYFKLEDSKGNFWYLTSSGGSFSATGSNGHEVYDGKVNLSKEVGTDDGVFVTKNPGNSKPDIMLAYDEVKVPRKVSVKAKDKRNGGWM